MVERYLDILLDLCKKAANKGEIPVAALIVDKDNKIISREINNRQKKHNILGHAEILAIQKAEKKKKDWRLDDCVMYVSLMPCDMCKKIIEESRISKIYYLVSNKKKNYDEKFVKIINNRKKEECEKLLKDFFINIR